MEFWNNGSEEGICGVAGHKVRWVGQQRKNWFEKMENEKERRERNVIGNI